MADGRTDAALLSAIGGRDMDAMRELYSRHAGWLAVRLGRREGPSRSEGEPAAGCERIARAGQRGRRRRRPAEVVQPPGEGG
jgi:hypothetical protein